MVPTNTWSLVVAMVVAPLMPASVTADDFSQRDRIYAVLSAPMNSIVAGKSFREAIQGIAKQAELNVWIDRRVDPTRPVTAEPVGPTVFSAIGQLAAQRDCVLMPVANVLLVGRRDWVDRTVSTILSLKLGSKRELADVTWDDLTTPEEAMTIAAGTPVAVEPALPHDLWPAASWKQVDRRVAVTLVLAQFDRAPLSTASLRRLQTAPATTVSCLRRYWFGDANATIRSAMKDTDGGSRFRTDRDWLLATGSAAAHRRAVSQLFDRASQVAPPDPGKDTFTLKPTRSTAENLLFNFARMAKRTCEIKADAAAACKQLVSLEADDATLQQLSDMVAEKVGVNVQWLEDRIVVSSRPR